MPARRALRLALAADKLSITTMDLVDSATVLLVPGAMAAGLADGVFVVAVPVNRALIARGRGHAALHRHPERAPGGAQRCPERS